MFTVLFVMSTKSLSVNLIATWMNILAASAASYASQTEVEPT